MLPLPLADGLDGAGGGEDDDGGDGDELEVTGAAGGEGPAAAGAVLEWAIVEHDANSAHIIQTGKNRHQRAAIVIFHHDTSGTLTPAR
jgi:hypothetical protein